MTEDPKIIPADLQPQIRRFCLYGFLKNLQFFEPFLILVFIDKGLSFTQIGLLVSLRAISTNVLEVPSGAIADTWGLRRSMIMSMLSYIASFILFAAAQQFTTFCIAMLCFSVGEAFRTGTHKAIIFNWISKKGMKSEKTRIYGLTRSWSKQGSSINCIVAAAILIFFRDYKWVFLLSVIPYGLNLINLFLYPKELDPQKAIHSSTGESFRVIASGIRLILSRSALSSLITENICFEGVFSVIKDYLQPILKTAALALPVMITASPHTRTAVLVAIVYFVLNQGSSMASRFSHHAARLAGSEQKLGAQLWIMASLLYALMLSGFYFNLPSLSISAFVVLFIGLNLWKPVFVSRFHDHAEEATAATTLSIANQSKTLVIAVAAPLIGTIIDHSKAISSTETIIAFWPIAAIGVSASFIGLLINKAKSRS